MGELLKELGLMYYFSRSVTSIADDVNAVHNTNYAYQMRCKIGIGKELPRSVWQRTDDLYIDFTWLAKLGYLGLK